MLIVDADVHLTNPGSLELLLKTAKANKMLIFLKNLNKFKIKFFSGILAPMVVQSGKLFSNFWGALSETGFYARSADYVQIVERVRLGAWNVPFMNSVFLISKEKLQQKNFLSAFSYNMKIDADMSFAHFCRDNVSIILYSF